MEYEGISGADIDSVFAGRHIPTEINPTSPSLPPDKTADERILPEPCLLHPEKPAYIMAKIPIFNGERCIARGGKAFRRRVSV